MKFSSASEKKEELMSRRYDKTVRKEESTLSENSAQSLLFDWAEKHEEELPPLKYLYAIPNSKSFQVPGVKSGLPDVCLAWPSGRFHSLYIELKRGRTRVTDEQKKWHKRLQEAGHLVRVCRRWEEARALLVSYIKSPVSLAP